jgi:hypothetical protein
MTAGRRGTRLMLTLLGVTIALGGIVGMRSVTPASSDPEDRLSAVKPGIGQKS